MGITHHTQLLQELIDKYKLESYLEIGVQNPANNFAIIKVKAELKYPAKVAVDPDKNIIWGEFANGYLHNNTSDEFFAFNTAKFDLIFLDGLHHADQVKKDFENSLKCVTDKGFIVLHDCLPENEEGTKVPRETKIWWGDVYKFCMTLNTYENIDFKTFNIDNGCCLVWKVPRNYGAIPLKFDLTFENYKKWGRLLMNIENEVEI